MDPSPTEEGADQGPNPSEVERRLRAENVRLASALNFYRVALIALVSLLLWIIYNLSRGG